MAIDVGTYSLKFLEFTVEKRLIAVESFQEVVIGQVQRQLNADSSLLDLQIKIISNVIAEKEFEGKIIYQVPTAMITTRYLHLPVNKRKKAEMMIPFQLEENLPFSVQNAHYILNFFPGSSGIEEGMSVDVNITNDEEFNLYHTHLAKNAILPDYLISEQIAIQSMIEQEQIKGPCCILDIGHTNTKSYYVLNGKVVANHLSYLAGRIIDEVIAKTYNISLEEAIVYKHANCFFLSEDQYSQVNAEQREFGKIMKQTFLPLVLDVQRWSVGLQTKYGINISQIYLTGGTAKIKNIDLFFVEALNVDVKMLPSSNKYRDYQQAFDASNSSYTLVNFFSIIPLQKKTIPNFLCRNYSKSYSDTIPLHSAIFVGYRIGIIAFFFIILMVLEIYYIKKNHHENQQLIQKLLRSNQLGLTQSKRNSFVRKPEKSLAPLNGIYTDLEKNIKVIMQLPTNDAVAPLAQLSKVINGNEEIDLVNFISDGNESRATFRSTSNAALKNLQDFLKSTSLKLTENNHIEKDNQLQIKYSWWLVMLKKINLFQKIDAFLFRLIEEMRSHPLYQLLIEKISLLPETTQKYFNYFVTVSIVVLPLLITLPFTLRMCSMSGEVQTQEKVISTINQIIELQNKFDNLTENIFSNLPLNNSKELATQLQEIISKSNLPPGSVRTKTFESDTSNSMFIRTQSSLQVENLTTEHLVNLLQELGKKFKVRVTGLQLAKDPKNMRITGEVKFDYFFQKNERDQWRKMNRVRMN